MLTGPTFTSMVIFLLVCLAICGAGFLVFLRAYGDQRQAVARLRNLSDEQSLTPGEGGAAQRTNLLQATLPRIGSYFLRGREQWGVVLKTKLVHAGYFHRSAAVVFLGVKALLVMTFVLLGLLVPYLGGWVSAKKLPLCGVAGGAAGMLAPSLWLAARVKKRQFVLRAGLPDALDMLVLSLEGGASLMAAIQRLAEDLPIIHPVLGTEMNVIQHEIQLGLSPGAALKHFGERSGLGDVRELASIILQSEHSGISVAKALRMHADVCRGERFARAREKAQKMAVKIIFPTLLCVFPAIFVVLLGPAAFQISRMFTR